MHPDPTEAPWLECDEWQGDDGLLGNRAGFELLRDAVQRILEADGAGEPVVLGIERGSIKVLKLCAPPPLPEPASHPAKIGKILLFAFLLSIPLFALFGFYQFIRLLFS